MVSEPKTEATSLTAAIVGVAFFATGPSIIAGAETDGITLAFWRVLVAWAFFALFMAARREFDRSALTQTAMAGIGFGIGSALLFEAVQLTSVANAVLIAVMQPVPLMVAGRLFFGERVRRLEVLWVLIAVGGAAVMVLSGSSSDSGDIRGDLLAAGSMLLTTVYFIGSRKARASLSMLPFMMGLWFWSTVSLAPIVLVSGAELVPAGGTEWLRVVGIAILPGLGHFLINYWHRGAPLALIGVLQLFNPAVATVLALWFLDQHVSGWQWLGMAIVIVALTVYTVIRSRGAALSASKAALDARSSADA